MRGDAAVLPSGAIADTTRWYIRGWDDGATDYYARKARPTTQVYQYSLGALKAAYRD